MSSEQNLPEVPVHQGPPPATQGEAFSATSSPHGMGQSKSSRRRRRKRKGKGGSDEGSVETSSQAGNGQGSVPSLQAAASNGAQTGAQNGAQNGAQSGSQTGPQTASQPSFQGGQSNSQAQPGGTKRWKKKFRDRDRRPQYGENSGQQANGGSSSAPQTPRDSNTHQFGNRTDSFKRKGGSGGGGKQQRDRGPRSFVGPMDHSYRAVNGNFIDAPPATIEQRGAGHFGRTKSYHSSSDSGPIDYSQGRPVPIPEDAPTRIYFFIEDLFFHAKISETSRKLGVKVAFIKNEKEALAELLALEEEKRPGLIVVDLNNANLKPMTLVPKIKAKFKRSTSVIGFLAQLQGDLRAKAVEAGCDTVMARSAFSQNLPNLLRRYGLEEESDESNFNS